MTPCATPGYLDIRISKKLIRELPEIVALLDAVEKETGSRPTSIRTPDTPMWRIALARYGKPKPFKEKK